MCRATTSRSLLSVMRLFVAPRKLCDKEEEVAEVGGEGLVRC